MTEIPLIRPYNKSDKEAVLHLLRINTPQYFATEEEKDLVFYLDHEIEYYFVMELHGKIIGCGGFNFSGNPALAKIAWDIIHPDFHGRSFGTQLLNYRLQTLKTFSDLKTIIVRTTQLVYPFYEKAGFRLTEKVKDHWAISFDMYVMEYTK